MFSLKLNKILLAVLFASLYLVNLPAQDHHMKMNMEKQMPDSMSVKNKASIVHKGIVDLKKIDANKDGKVFQDQMHWNVISDKKEKCPLCGMTLQEVSLKTAKENLLKNNFKVKK